MSAARRNRRASTWTVRDNRIFDVRVTVDGFGVRRSALLYYRRRFAGGRLVTGAVTR